MNWMQWALGVKKECSSRWLPLGKAKALAVCSAYLLWHDRLKKYKWHACAALVSWALLFVPLAVLIDLAFPDLKDQELLNHSEALWMVPQKQFEDLDQVVRAWDFSKGKESTPWEGTIYNKERFANALVLQIRGLKGIQNHQGYVFLNGPQFSLYRQFAEYQSFMAMQAWLPGEELNPYASESQLKKSYRASSQFQLPSQHQRSPQKIAAAQMSGEVGAATASKRKTPPQWVKAMMKESPSDVLKKKMMWSVAWDIDAPQIIKVHVYPAEWIRSIKEGWGFKKNWSETQHTALDNPQVQSWIQKALWDQRGVYEARGFIFLSLFMLVGFIIAALNRVIAQILISSKSSTQHFLNQGKEDYQKRLILKERKELEVSVPPSPASDSEMETKRALRKRL